MKSHAIITGVLAVLAGLAIPAVSQAKMNQGADQARYCNRVHDGERSCCDRGFDRNVKRACCSKGHKKHDNTTSDLVCIGGAENEIWDDAGFSSLGACDAAGVTQYNVCLRGLERKAAPPWPGVTDPFNRPLAPRTAPAQQVEKPAAERTLPKRAAVAIIEGGDHVKDTPKVAPRKAAPRKSTTFSAQLGTRQCAPGSPSAGCCRGTECYHCDSEGKNCGWDDMISRRTGRAFQVR